MKKILCIALAVMLLTACFAGCAAKPAAESTAPTDESAAPSEPAASAADDDLAYITGNGKMVIGYTVYEPMNYTDNDGKFTGFDTEFAELVCEKLGVEPEFVVINWDTKEVELNAKTIDCIWNGLTITTDRQDSMSISVPYVKNAQVVVVKADSGITGTADLAGKNLVAEVASAGELQILGDEETEPNADLAKANYTAMSKQTDCLLEVKAGTADAAILDWTLAKSMVGEGTDFSDLKMIDGVELATEEYGIAFRKGSSVTEKVNEIIAELVADGTLPALAEKYGLSLSPEISK